MLNRELLEEKLAELPLFQYEFIKTEELLFSENIRYICKTECPMYDKTWACPPGVGEVSECKARVLSFEDALCITTVTEVNDIADIEETLATRGPHEAITRQVRDLVAEQGCETYVLSTEACAHCEDCAYPDEPCRHPEYMFPCVESHGIIVTDIAEKHGIAFMNGNIVTWFSLILYKD